MIEAAKKPVISDFFKNKKNIFATFFGREKGWLDFALFFFVFSPWKLENLTRTRIFTLSSTRLATRSTQLSSARTRTLWTRTWLDSQNSGSKPPLEILQIL